MFVAGIEIFFGFIVGGFLLWLGVMIVVTTYCFSRAFWNELFGKAKLKRKIAAIEREMVQ